jgi:plastocyanin
VMLRDLRAEVTTPISDGTPGFASEPAVSGDGRLVAFTAGTRVPRLYLRDVAAGTTSALTDADAGAVVDPQLSTDGSTLAYTLVRAGRSRVEVRGLRSREVQTVASTRGSVTDPSLSADGAVLAFTSDAPDMSADKADRTRGVFVRDLRSGATTLVSPPTARAAGSAKPVAVARAPAARRPVSGGSLRAPVVSIVDNAFVRGREEPRLRVRPGTVVTWRWRSQSSHNVSVRSGPERFRASTRSRGVIRRRFAQAGSYRIVCTLHSPGMHMTVVVR